MKIAVPIWNEYVSGVFDFAHKLLLVTIDNGKEIDRSEMNLPAEQGPQRVNRLIASQADVLVCGAVSHVLACMIQGAGIKLVSQVCGTVDQVLQAYLDGELERPEFRLPGCCHRGQRRSRRRRGRCR